MTHSGSSLFIGNFRLILKNPWLYPATLPGIFTCLGQLFSGNLLLLSNYSLTSRISASRGCLDEPNRGV